MTADNGADGFGTVGDFRFAVNSAHSYGVTTVTSVLHSGGQTLERLMVN